MGFGREEGDPPVDAFHKDRQSCRPGDRLRQRCVVGVGGTRTLQPHRIDQGVQHAKAARLGDLFGPQQHLAGECGDRLMRFDTPEARVTIT